tara:strand:+ start:14489 stop:15619 length:1131 start_codon:yes stop_codon:yes gene_type:complete
MDIRTSKISFCNKNALNLTSDKFKAFLLNNLREEYNISITDRNAYILNNKSVRNLSKNPHLISVKTCGSNYYLYLTRINEINYSFFIDKKIKNGYSYPRIISVNYNFPKDLYNNTLVEGELIRDNDNEWLFLIFDIRCYKGVSQKEVNLIHKIRNIYSLFDDYNEDIDMQPCSLQVKKFFNYCDFEYIQDDFIPSLPYRVNGLFFNTLQPKHHNYLHFFPRKNMNNNQSKQQTSYQSKQKSSHQSKPQSIQESSHQASHHMSNNITHKMYQKQNNITDKQLGDTMVFVIKTTNKPDVYNLYCVKNNSLVKYGLACVPTMKCSKFIRSIFINSGKDIDVKVECDYNKKFKKWQPKALSSVLFPDEFSRIKSFEEVIE